MNLNGFKFFVIAILGVFLSTFPGALFAQHEEHGVAESPHAEEEKKGFNASEVICSHIMDAHEFHLFEYHH